MRQSETGFKFQVQVHGQHLAPTSWQHRAVAVGTGPGTAVENSDTARLGLRFPSSNLAGARARGLGLRAAEGALLGTQACLDSELDSESIELELPKRSEIIAHPGSGKICTTVRA
jgi:hypothetical protein